MTTSELNNAAWDLVEHARDSLTAGQLTAAFVSLGLAEHGDAITIALTGIIARGGPPLPDELATRLAHLQRVHYFDEQFDANLTAASQLGRRPTA